MSKLLSDFSRVILKQFVVLLLIIGFSSIGYYFRNDIRISYHKWGLESALKSMRKHGSIATKEEMDKFQKYSHERQKHEDALMELGYLEERIFETKYLGAISPEMHKAAEEFSERYPGSLYSIGERGEYKIKITCQKDLMPTMDELIRKYDVPPDDPNESVTPVKSVE